MIQFYCSECDHKYCVPDEYAGKKAKCKKCKAVNVIPDKQDFDFSENYDSNAEYYDVFRELLRWEKTAPTVEAEEL